jgi:hypothetical protein
MIFFDLASKPVVTVFSCLTLKSVAMVSPGLASKLVAMISPDLSSKLMVEGSPVWASKPIARFGDLSLKITTTVSWFVPQNQVDDGLSVTHQNR